MLDILNVVVMWLIIGGILGSVFYLGKLTERRDTARRRGRSYGGHS